MATVDHPSMLSLSTESPRVSPRVRFTLRELYSGVSAFYSEGAILRELYSGGARVFQSSDGRPPRLAPL